MRNIRQNLFFAFVYNALGVPIAAGVLYPFFGLLLSPMIAAAAMSFSSVSVDRQCAAIAEDCSLMWGEKRAELTTGLGRGGLAAAPSGCGCRCGPWIDLHDALDPTIILRRCESSSSSHASGAVWALLPLLPIHPNAPMSCSLSPMT